MMRTSALNVPELLEEADAVLIADAEDLIANLSF